MEEVAAEVPPGANGLLALFSNVMDVKRWVQAPPSFVGFDLADPARTDRRACIRAVQEQAAFATRGHLAILRELSGQSFTEIGFAGGAAKGSLWPRIVADVLGVSVRVPVVKEATALGAALFAGLGVGLYRRPAERDPGGHAHRAHHRARSRHHGRLRRGLRPLVGRLSTHPRPCRGPPGGAHVVACRRRCPVPSQPVLIVRTGPSNAKEHSRCLKPTAATASSSTPTSPPPTGRST